MTQEFYWQLLSNVLQCSLMTPITRQFSKFFTKVPLTHSLTHSPTNLLTQPFTHHLTAVAMLIKSNYAFNVLPMDILGMRIAIENLALVTVKQLPKCSRKAANVRAAKQCSQFGVWMLNSWNTGTVQKKTLLTRTKTGACEPGWGELYLGKDKRPLLQHTDDLKAAQSSDQEGVVGLRPVAAHHLHRYSCSANPTQRKQWVWWREGDLEQPRQISQSNVLRYTAGL